MLQTEGVTPYNMCILKGFPTALKSTTSFPFGMWFANANTLYVADEGNGDNTFSTANGMYTAAAAQTTAGLQKWVFNGTSWKLAYTLDRRPEPGRAVHRPGYPTGNNAGDRPAVVAGHRRPAQHHRPRQPRRHGDDLGASPRPSAAAATRAPTRTSWCAITDPVGTAPAAGERFRPSAPPASPRCCVGSRSPRERGHSGR